ncbi:hypothetical protein ACWD25_33125 [Streptomyces sp. NPDC002920]
MFRHVRRWAHAAAGRIRPVRPRTPRHGLTGMVAAAGVLGAMLVPLSVPATATAATTTTSTVGATATSAAAGQWHMVRGRIMDNVEVAGNTTVTVTVAGKGWLPSSNLASVALNIGAEGRSTTGSLKVYSTDDTEPASTAMSYGTDNYQANLVITKVGADGRIKLVNTGSGAVRVYLDDQGYTLTTAGSTVGGTYVPVDPTQILNNVTVAANSTYRMTPLGQSPVPSSGVQAVSVSVTALSTGTGTVRVYGAGDITPADATLDYAADTIEQNFAIAKIGTNTLLDSAGAGVVNINNFGFSPVTISVAVTGYFTSGTASTTGALVHALTPSRIADTVSIAAGDDFALPVLGQGGIPTSKPAAVGLNLTADSAGAGVITVSSAGLTDTGFNTVAYHADAPISTFTTARVGCSGQVVLTNTGSSAVTVSVDAYAYFGNPDTTATSADGTTAATVENVTGVSDINQQTTSDAGNVAVSSCTDDMGTNTVEVPRTASSGVSLTSMYGTIKVGLPSTGTGTRSVTGTVVYPGSQSGYSTAVQPTDDGGFRALVTLDGSSSPTSYDFPVTLPAGVRMVAGDDSDGTVDIVQDVTAADGTTEAQPLGVIEEPWATDAAGVSWPATYTVNGSTLTLHVDLTPVTDASGTTVSPTFPVVADPRWKWSCWRVFCYKGTLYLNRGETANARNAGWISNTLFEACTMIPGLAGAICRALHWYSSYLAGRATRYYAWGGCLKIVLPYGIAQYQQRGAYNCS